MKTLIVILVCIQLFISRESSAFYTHAVNTSGCSTAYPIELCNSFKKLELANYFELEEDHYATSIGLTTDMAISKALSLGSEGTLMVAIIYFALLGTKYSVDLTTYHKSAFIFQLKKLLVQDIQEYDASGQLRPFLAQVLLARMIYIPDQSEEESLATIYDEIIEIQ